MPYILFISIQLLIQLTILCEDQNCPERSISYGTKTVYENAFNGKEVQERSILWKLRGPKEQKDSGLTPPVNNQQCQIAQVNMVIRHGTRNPSTKDVLKAQAFLDKLRNKITNKEFFFINNWKMPYDVGDAWSLSHVGIHELYGLGKRIKTAMPDYFTGQQNITFYSSHMERALDSARAFQSGFFSETLEPFKLNIAVRDDLLRYYDNCSKHIYETKKGPGAKKEFAAFTKGQNIKQVIDGFKQKLSLKNEDITYSDLKALYTATAIEHGTVGNSIWQKLWSQNDLKIMEYAADLNAYWKKGYGYQLNYEQSCPLLRDMFLHLDEAVQKKNNNTSARGVFRFGHSEAILTLLGLIGLFKDESNLRSDNMDAMQDRQFRTSKISPFSSNIAFVLYKCNNSEIGSSAKNISSAHTTTEESYFIRLLVNEKLFKFPACDNEFCPYNVVRDSYKKYIEKCNFELLCKLDEHAHNI